MGDEDSAEAIMTLDDPNEIKKRGRRVKNFNQDIWESCCQDIVERGNMEKVLLKYTQHSIVNTYICIIYEILVIFCSLMYLNDVIRKSKCVEKNSNTKDNLAIYSDRNHSYDSIKLLNPILVLSGPLKFVIQRCNQFVC